MLPKLKIIFQLQEHAPIVENGAPVIEILLKYYISISGACSRYWK